MRFDWFFLVIPVFFVFGVAHLAWRFFRSGSLTGALLGGRITRELGEIPIATGMASSTVLKVHAMASSDGEPGVALVIVSKALLGASMMPVKLTRSRTRQLMSLLQQAIDEG